MMKDYVEILECPMCKELELHQIGETECFDEFECACCGYYCTFTKLEADNE